MSLFVSEETIRDEQEWLVRFREAALRDMETGVALPASSMPALGPLAPRALPRTIWLYWAQGWAQAPAQSRLCLESWKRHNPDWTIVTLDDANIGEHVDLDGLLDGKEITVTGFSNHLRMHLLSQYGGVWTDASTYCSRPLGEWLPSLMQSGFFAFARPGPDRLLSTWFLAAEPGNHIVTTWRDLLRRYWRAVDKADFYHWTHYLFAEGCRSDPLMNALWQRTPWVSADGPHEVQMRADEESAEDLLGSLAERRVPVHKLETRRAALPEPGARTPLARLLFGLDAATERSGTGTETAVSVGGGSHCPRASVVMTAYNDLRFLDDAVDSVLQQDFPDFELILVDDGTGETARFEMLAGRDPRIRVLVNAENLGTAVAANRAIAESKGDIIVRLDADDYAEPTRLGRLIAALDQDPELGVIGSAVTLIDEAGNVRGVQPMPETDLEIRWTILFYNPFYHSAAAFRRELFERAGRYRAEELVSQDHYLWFQMLPLCKARNLQEPLVRYRLNSRGLTAMNAQGSPRSRTHPIREALWAQLGLPYLVRDDALAGDVNHFLRGHPIAVERRWPAYRTILTALQAFRASAQAQAADRILAGRLARKIVGRILNDPPPDRSEVLALSRQCWSIDPRFVLSFALERVVEADSDKRDVSTQ